MNKRTSYLLFWIVIPLLLLDCRLLDAEVRTEYEVKAAFLFAFTKYIEWPENSFKEATDPIIIGIFDDEIFCSVLEKTVAGKTSNNRPLEIRLLETIDESRFCNVVYTPKCDDGDICRSLVNHSHVQHILTVCDSEDFSEEGGVIQFLSKGSNIRFEINISNADMTGIKISSKLLKLAEVVKK